MTRPTLGDVQAEVAEHCTAAGMKPDSPLRAALMATARATDALLDATMGLTVLPGDGVARLEQAAATGADRRAADLARSRNRQTIMIISAGLAGAVLLALGAGFAWGRQTANAAIAETDRRLVAAYQDGPGTAAAWASLMEQNDLRAALAACTGDRVYTDASGRRACAVPLWIEPPKRTPPT